MAEKGEGVEGGEEVEKGVERSARELQENASHSFPR